jgi:hypothetical protein
LLSDFSRHAELELPIRWSHFAAIDKSDETPQDQLFDVLKPMVKRYSPNIDLYSAMLAVHGISMDQYASKLMFGKHISWYLEQEQELWKKTADTYLFQLDFQNKTCSETDY